MSPRSAIALIAGLFGLALPASASALPSGGLAAPGRPAIASLSCSGGAPDRCRRGGELRIGGHSLQGVTRVRFLGARGARDDRSVRPVAAERHEVRVRVPARTRSGPVEVIGSTGRARARKVTIVAEPPGGLPIDAAPVDEGQPIFPIRGAHAYGTAISRFGGGRGHQGQDVFARCGTPLVAALPGRVIQSIFQSRAGNYAVVQMADGRSYAYMHMRRRALVRTGDVVAAGEPIGEVGETGRATGCHLHFELWTAPGWYRGGRPVDPLRTLRSWE